MTTSITSRVDGTANSYATNRFPHFLLLSGDMTDSGDRLLLSGDMSDDDDALLLSGDVVTKVGAVITNP